ncbi:hypothetical protein NSA56_07665 [Oceanobacillus caeni]|uniref:hypothetical protein n=2 Tax=Oceanobacillus caeni TaxID=405946 RepID=UPI001958AEF8|nr:hypothetical protein [Oceanobacillus caeni]MBU8789989.1 hypothetical protein [Oceanobacillus caeni]MCR1834274.1 hypothetical protein [Oceanobacillus caeni]
MLVMVDRRNEKVYGDIYQELEGIAMKDAFQGWEELSMTQEEYLAYESRLKRIMDDESSRMEAEIREKKAVKDNKKSIARKLLAKGMEPKEVGEVTELPMEKVLELKEEMRL